MLSNMSGRRASWCILGALLAGMPFSVRSLTAILYGAPCVAAPLQYPVLVVLTSLILLVLLERYLRGKARAAVLGLVDRWGMFVACLAIAFSCFCELIWYLADYGAYDLYELSNELQGASELLQMLAIVLWALLGISRSLVDSEREVLVSRNSEGGAFLVGAVWTVAAPIVCMAVAPWTVLPFLICVLSAAGAYVLLARMHIDQRSQEEAYALVRACLGGVLLASGFSGALGDVLLICQPNYPYFDAASSLAVLAVLYLLYACIVGAVSVMARFIAKRKDGQAVPDQLQGVDILPESANLSVRQRDVLTLLLSGSKGSDIARRLGISAGSVGAYRSRALAKLGCASLQELRDKLDGVEAERLSLKRELGSRRGRRGVFVGCAAVTALCVLFFIGTSVILPRGVILSLEWVISAASLARLLGGSAESRSGRIGEEALVLVSVAAIGGLVQWLLMSTGGVYDELSLVILVLAGAYRARIGMVQGDDEVTTLPAPVAVLWGIRCVVVGSSVNMLIAVWGAIVFGSGQLMGELGNVLIFLSYGLCAVLGMLFVLGLMVPSSSREEDNELKDRSIIAILKNRWGLTSLEAKVVLLASRGRKRLEICRCLFIAPGTVNGCKARAYKKLGIHSADELNDLLENSR